MDTQEQPLTLILPFAGITQGKLYGYDLRRQDGLRTFRHSDGLTFAVVQLLYHIKKRDNRMKNG